MNESTLWKAALSALILAVAAGQTARANFVSDGDFSGDAGQAPGQDGGPWTLSPASPDYGFPVNFGYDFTTNNAPPGSGPAWIDGAGGADDFLSQALATSSGTEYSIGFWLLASGNAGQEVGTDDDTVLWNNTVVFDANLFGSGTPTTQGTYYANGTLDGAIDYGLWNWIVIDPLGTGGDTLTLGIENDFSFDEITNVDVESTPINPDQGPFTPVNPNGGDGPGNLVTETAPTLALLGAGLIALAGGRRRWLGSCSPVRA